jgi:hypothetical protein
MCTMHYHKYKPDDLLSVREVAAVYSMAWGSIQNWRYVNKGPAWHKIGHRVVYLFADVEEYAQARGIKCN